MYGASFSTPTAAAQLLSAAAHLRRPLPDLVRRLPAVLAPMERQVQQALQALYHGTTEQKEQANTFLEAFQASPEAWQVAHDMLAVSGGAGKRGARRCS